MCKVGLWAGVFRFSNIILVVLMKVLLGVVSIWISGHGVKQFAFHSVSGTHQISWRPEQKKKFASFQQSTFCRRMLLDFIYNSVWNNSCPKSPACWFTMQILGLPASIITWRESESEVAQLCPTLWDPMVCSLPDSSIHGIFQARILDWVALPSAGDLPDPGSKLGLPHCRQSHLDEPILYISSHTLSLSLFLSGFVLFGSWLSRISRVIVFI